MSPSLRDLREEFRDPEYRQAYADDYLNTYIATQIQVLREQRGLSQEELANLIGTKQPGVSRLENVNHSSWKTDTLRKIAHALDVRLKISFETYGDLLFEVNSFGRKVLQRPDFTSDYAFNSELARQDTTGIFRLGTGNYYVVSNATAATSEREGIVTTGPEITHAAQAAMLSVAA